MDIRTALEVLVAGKDLSKIDMSSIFFQVMKGEATEAQIGAFLVALRIKGETIDEISSAAQVMRNLVEPIHCDKNNLIDLVGTGGDGANLFNVSTGASFVAAAAGARVAKHGNRSVSSSSGSSDLLEYLGVPLNLNPEQIAMLIETVGIGFMFAPNHHKTMKYAAGPRKEIGLRTLFNILGPLTNPAGVNRQVVGVFSEKLCEPIARSLEVLGSEHVIVIHSKDGLDEISIAAETLVCELRFGKLKNYIISPFDFNFPIYSLDGLDVRNASESAELIRGALLGRSEKVYRKAYNMLAMNAGAAIYVADLVSSLEEGVSEAVRVLSNGKAYAKLNEFVELTRNLTC